MKILKLYSIPNINKKGVQLPINELDRIEDLEERIARNEGYRTWLRRKISTTESQLRGSQ